MKKLLKIFINLFTLKTSVLHGGVSWFEATSKKERLTFESIKTYSSIPGLILQIKQEIIKSQKDSVKKLEIDDIKISNLHYQDKGFQFRFEIPKDKLILALESKKVHQINSASLKIDQNLFYSLNFDYQIKKENNDNNLKLRKYLNSYKQKIVDAVAKKIQLGLIQNPEEFKKDFLSSFDYDVYRQKNFLQKLSPEEIENEIVKNNQYYLKIRFENNIFLNIERFNNKEKEIDLKFSVPKDLSEFDFNITNPRDLTYKNLLTEIEESLINFSSDDNKITKQKLKNLTKKQLAITILDNNDAELNKDTFNDYYGAFKIKIEAKNNAYFKGNKTIAKPNIKKNYYLNLEAIDFNHHNFNILNTDKQIIDGLRQKIDTHLQNQKITSNNFDYDITITNPEIKAKNKVLTINFTSNNDSFLSFAPRQTKKIKIKKIDLSQVLIEPLNLNFETTRNSSGFISTIKQHVKNAIIASEPRLQSITLNDLKVSGVENLIPGTKKVAISVLAEHPLLRNRVSLDVNLEKMTLNLNEENFLNDIRTFVSKTNLEDQIKTKIWSWYKNTSDNYQENLIEKNDINLNFVFTEKKLKVNYTVEENKFFNSFTGTLNLNNAKFDISSVDFSSRTPLFLNNYQTTESLKEKGKQQFLDVIINNLNLGTNINTEDLTNAIRNSLNDNKITIYEIDGQQRSDITDVTKDLGVYGYEVKFNLANNNYLTIDDDSNLATLSFNLDWDTGLKANLNNFNYSINDDDAINLNYASLITNIKQELVTLSPSSNPLTMAKLNTLINDEHKLAITFLKDDNSILNENDFNHYYGVFKIKVEALGNNAYFKSSQTISKSKNKRIYVLDLNALNLNQSNLNALNTNEEIIMELRTKINNYLQSQQIDDSYFDYALTFENADVNADDVTSKNLHFLIRSNNFKLQFLNNATNINVTVAKYNLADLNLNRLEIDFNAINNQDDFKNLIINHLKAKLDESYSSILLDYFNSITISNIENFTPKTKTITTRALADDLYFQNHYDLEVEIVKGVGLVNTNQNFLDEIVSYHSKDDLENQIKAKIRNWYVEKISQAGDDDSSFISVNDIDLRFNFENYQLNVDYTVAANSYFQETSGNFVLNHAKINTESFNFDTNFWTTTKILTADDAGNVQWLKQEAKNYFVKAVINRLGFREEVSDELMVAIQSSLNNFLVFDDQDVELSNLNQDLGVLQYKVSFSLQNNNYLVDVDNNLNLFFNLDWDDNLKADLNNLQFAENKMWVFDLFETIAGVESTTPTQKTAHEVVKLLKDKKLIIKFRDENNVPITLGADNADIASLSGTIDIEIEINKNRYFKTTPPQTPIVKENLETYVQRLDINNIDFTSKNINALASDEEIISQLKLKLTSYLEDIDLFSVLSRSNINPLKFDIRITSRTFYDDLGHKVLTFKITTTNRNLHLVNALQSITIKKINLADFNIPKLNLEFVDNRDFQTVKNNIFNHILTHTQEDYPNLR